MSTPCQSLLSKFLAHAVLLGLLTEACVPSTQTRSSSPEIPQDPEYRRRLSEVLEGLDGDSVVLSERAFALGYSTGQVDGLKYHIAAEENFTELGCEGALPIVLESGLAAVGAGSLADCSVLQHPQSKQTAIPGEAFANARLTIVRSTPALYQQVALGAFETGYYVSANESAHTTIDMVRECTVNGCKFLLTKYSLAGLGAKCEELGGESVATYLEALRTQRSAAR